MTHSGGKTIIVGDQGQRYEVRFNSGDDGDDSMGYRVFGWSSTEEGAQDYVDAINAHPSWHSPRIVDRHEPEDKDPQA